MTHTVLVVEDEEELREMMRDALELNGYLVVTAEDGQDALDKISGIEHLCLVILDLLMPVMNGWDFVERMRQRAEADRGPRRRAFVGADRPTRRRHARPSEADELRPPPVDRRGILRPLASPRTPPPLRASRPRACGSWRIQRRP
jgi:CheY-like chemotaxis protein